MRMGLAHTNLTQLHFPINIHRLYLQTVIWHAVPVRGHLHDLHLIPLRRLYTHFKYIVTPKPSEHRMDRKRRPKTVTQVSVMRMSNDLRD